MPGYINCNITINGDTMDIKKIIAIFAIILLILVTGCAKDKNVVDELPSNNAEAAVEEPVEEVAEEEVSDETKDLEGLSTKESAQVTELSVSAVKVRLHRARLILRERLAESLIARSDKFARAG